MAKLTLVELVTYGCLLLVVGANAIDDKLASKAVWLQKNGYGELVQSRLQKEEGSFFSCYRPDRPKHGGYKINDTDIIPEYIEYLEDLTVVSFYCDSNFILEGDRYSVCNYQEWTKNIPTCVANVTCVLPEFPENGHYEILEPLQPPLPGHLVDEFTIIKFQCSPAFDLEGALNSVCRAAKWGTPVPACVRSNRCTIPDRPQSGSYSIVGSSEAPEPGASVEEHKALKYDCPEDSLGGSTETVLVCFQGEWVGDTPKCAANKSTSLLLKDLSKLSALYKASKKNIQ